MENVALVTSQETWLRMHEGQAGAWLVTSNDGLPRVEKPPLLTWLDFLSWSDLSPQTTTPVQLTYRARLVTAGLGLITLASIFWIGHTLGDLRMAVIAALVAGSMFFLQRQARTASYDIHFVAWATLSVAAALWAMRGDRFFTSPSAADSMGGRRIAGWSIAGIAMACSVLSKNPLSYAIVLLPVVGAAALSPSKWKANLTGIIAMALIGLLPVVPWYWHVSEAYPEAVAILKREFRQPRDEWLPIYYYLGLFGLVMPWTVWLICGLIHPWTLKNPTRRRTACIALVWFAAIFVMFSCHPAKQQRYILPIIPAAALLCAQQLREHQRLADSGERDRLAIQLGGLIWAGALVASLLLGPLLARPDWFILHGGPLFGWLSADQFVRLNWPAACVVGGALAMIAIVGWCLNGRWKPMNSAIALAAWALAATCAYWSVDYGEPRRTHEVNHFKTQAERLAAMIGPSPIRSLRQNVSEAYRLNEEFRFYFGRLIRRIGPSELKDFAGQSKLAVFILVQPKELLVQKLRAAEYQLVDGNIVTDNGDAQQLWTHPALAYESSK